MIHYFLLTSRFFSRLVSNEQFDESNFKRFVPPLPDILHSRLVLQQFRWEGTEMSEKETKRDDTEEEEKTKPLTGTTWCFLWRYRGDIFEILAFASAWIIFVFLSPLSMNLVSSIESILNVFADFECLDLGLSFFVTFNHRKLLLWDFRLTSSSLASLSLQSRHRSAIKALSIDSRNSAFDFDRYWVLRYSRS